MNYLCDRYPNKYTQYNQYAIFCGFSYIKISHSVQMNGF